MTSLRGWLQARGGCCGETGGLSPTGSAPKGVAAQPSVLVALEPTWPSALSSLQSAKPGGAPSALSAAGRGPVASVVAAPRFSAGAVWLAGVGAGPPALCCLQGRGVHNP